MLIYLLWPVLFLLINYRKGRMTFLSGLLLRLAATLLLLNTSFYLLFFTGVFRVSCRDALQYGFWRFTMPTKMVVARVFPVIPFFNFPGNALRCERSTFHKIITGLHIACGHIAAQKTPLFQQHGLHAHTGGCDGGSDPCRAS